MKWIGHKERLPEEGDVITAVLDVGEKVYVFSKDWHVVLRREREASVELGRAQEADTDS